MWREATGKSILSGYEKPRQLNVSTEDRQHSCHILFYWYFMGLHFQTVDQSGASDFYRATNVLFWPAASSLCTNLDDLSPVFLATEDGGLAFSVIIRNTYPLQDYTRNPPPISEETSRRIASQRMRGWSGPAVKARQDRSLAFVVDPLAARAGSHDNRQGPSGQRKDKFQSA